MRFVCQMLLESFAQRADLIDVETLIWVYFKHADEQTAQFRAIPFWRRWEFTPGDSLKQLVEIQILFVRGPKGTSESC